MHNTESTSSDSRESDTPSGSETSSTHSSSSHSSHSGDEIEVITSTKDVESDIQPKEEPVDTQNEVEHKEKSDKKDKKKKRRPLVLGLSIGIPLLVVVVIIIVCCILLIKKKTEAPSITASVEMNGESREVRDGDVMNKLPTFSLSSEEI